MFEYENDIWSLEDLQQGAKDQGLDFDAYLEGMKKLGMVEKQTDSATADPITESSTDLGSDDGFLESPEDKGFLEDIYTSYKL